MLSRTFTTRNISYLVLGLTFFQSLLSRVMGSKATNSTHALEAQNDTDAMNTTATIITGLVTAAAEVGIAYALSAANQTIITKKTLTRETLDELITVGEGVVAGAAKKKLLINILWAMYQDENNIVDHCKLNVLLDTGFEIKIMTEKDFKEISPDPAYAAYSVIKNCIAIPEAFASGHANLLKGQLSHELRHAIDRDDNHKAGRWPREQAGKNYTDSMIWGSPTKILPTAEYKSEIQNLLHVSNDIIGMDLAYLYLLYDTVLKPKSKLTPLEQVFCQQLHTEIKKSGYKPMLNQIMVANIEQGNTYQLSKNKQKYILIKGQEYFHFKQNGRDYYVVEYSVKPRKEVIVTHTHPKTKKPENLARDLLINLRLRIDKVQTLYNSTQIAIPSEIAAHIDEVLAPHPKIKEMLFPRLTQYQLERASEEHKSCLQAKRPNRP